jgi:hypothetical protein
LLEEAHLVVPPREFPYNCLQLTQIISAGSRGEIFILVGEILYERFSGNPIFLHFSTHSGVAEVSAQSTICGNVLRGS